MFYTPVEVWDRCPECRAAILVSAHIANASQDAARDRGLLRRDVNEILEMITLEVLEEAK